MSNLYYFIEPSGYNKFVAAAADGMMNAKVFPGYRSSLVEMLFKLHNAWPLNCKFEMPFKFFWNIIYTKAIPKECNYVLMAESFHLSYSKSFLRYLHKHYMDSKVCFVFSNPVGTYNLAKIEKFKEFYDAIITFSKDDAQDYGFMFCDVLPFRLPKADFGLQNECDVFFIGSNKGRLNKIYNIYDRLDSLGLKCKFYIVGVPLEDQRQAEGIVYNKKLSYEEVLLYVQRTKCILEVLQDGCNYVSIKTYEAIHYHKKLLTTNQYLCQCNLYDEQFVKVIKKAEDIEKTFFDNMVPDEVFSNLEAVESFEPLMSFLDEAFQ